MDELYREVLLEHYKNPQNSGKLINPDIVQKDSNPLCGDVVEFYLRLKEGKVTEVSFEGKGCVICMATSDILSEKFKGMSLDEIQSMQREEVLDILGLNLTHTRVKCAMLPLVAVKKGIIEFKSKGEKK